MDEWVIRGMNVMWGNRVATTIRQTSGVSPMLGLPHAGNCRVFAIHIVYSPEYDPLRSLYKRIFSGFIGVAVEARWRVFGVIVLL